MRRTVLLAVCLLLAAPAAAQAEGLRYLSDKDGWVVYPDFPDRCIAFNRIAEEFNNAPFNALSLKQKAKSEVVEFTAYFWPDAFAPGETQTTLHIQGASAASLDVGARIDNGFKAIVETAPTDLLALLQSELFVTIAPQGKTSPPLFFRTSHAPDALRQLAECSHSG